MTAPWGGVGIAALLSVLAFGCAPRPSVIHGTSTVRVDPESLRVAALRIPPAPSCQGRGSMRLEIERRRLPALNLRFGLRDGAALWAILRPGVLAPVLSLWAGADGWSVRLPRERTALEVDASDPGGSPLSGPEIARLAHYVLLPQAALGDLVGLHLLKRGEDWILRGRLSGLPEDLAVLEVWITQTDLAVKRWSLWGRDGRSLLRVAYDPPRLLTADGGADQGAIHFVISSLEAVGTVQVGNLSLEPPAPFTPPPVPARWDVVSGSRLRRLLDKLQASPEPSEGVLSN